MSYQIKLTPYFQRMLVKSKRNGQLQMLKQEYDRIDLLDERKIEMKMRKVRLSKLKSEIEKIRKCESGAHRRNSKYFTQTEESKRIQNIKNARQLGKYFSQRNMEDAVCEATADPQLLKKKFKINESFSKRNEISNRNMRKFRVMKLHKEIDDNIETKQITRTNFRKSEKQPILNGNTKTSESLPKIINLSTISRDDFQINKSCDDFGSVLALSGNVQFIDLEAIDRAPCANSTKMEDSILPFDPRTNIKANSARKLWQKIAVYVKHNERSNKSGIETTVIHEPLNTVEDLLNDDKHICTKNQI